MSEASRLPSLLLCLDLSAMLTLSSFALSQATQGDPARASEASSAIAAEAVRRWAAGGETRRDDITVIVLMFANLTREEAEAEQSLQQQVESGEGLVPDVSMICFFLASALCAAIGWCSFTSLSAFRPFGPLHSHFRMRMGHPSSSHTTRLLLLMQTPQAPSFLRVSRSHWQLLS